MIPKIRNFRRFDSKISLLVMCTSTSGLHSLSKLAILSLDSGTSLVLTSFIDFVMLIDVSIGILVAAFPFYPWLLHIRWSQAL